MSWGAAVGRSSEPTVWSLINALSHGQSRCGAVREPGLSTYGPAGLRHSPGVGPFHGPRPVAGKGIQGLPRDTHPQRGQSTCEAGGSPRYLLPLCFLGSSLARARAGRTQATSPGLLGRLVGKVVGGGVQSIGIRFLLGERLRRRSVKGPAGLSLASHKGHRLRCWGRTFNGIHRA